VYNEFQKVVERCNWNRSEDLPIIPAVHVTRRSTAWQIAASGFAALATYDSGYYGKGIYFSTNAIYGLLYFSRNQMPAVIISYILPGNIYPVIEDPNDKTSTLLGKGISPYHSNYVLVQLDGMPVTEIKHKNFDELVIDQEGNVLPAYILFLSTKNLLPIYEQLKKVDDFELMSHEQVSINLENSASDDTVIPLSPVSKPYKSQFSQLPKRTESVPETMPSNKVVHMRTESVTEVNAKSKLAQMHTGIVQPAPLISNSSRTSPLSAFSKPKKPQEIRTTSLDAIEKELTKKSHPEKSEISTETHPPTLSDFLSDS